MYLEDSYFYKELCWAIKKYTKLKQPDPKTEIHKHLELNGDDHDINTMTTWAYTPNGHEYWSMAHMSLLGVYKSCYYFDKMIKDYNLNIKKGLQLDFENLYDDDEIKIGSLVKFLPKEISAVKLKNGYTGKVIYIYSNPNNINTSIAVLWDEEINGHNGNFEIQTQYNYRDFKHQVYCVSKKELEIIKE